MSSGSDESMAAVSREFYRRGSTDGLPIVPPTEERVAELLRGTDLPRDHVLGELGNRKGKLTVEGLATNAVMAGCTPVHMPVLEAGARALADPDANAIMYSVSAGSWANLWLVNGPIRELLDVRSGTGAFGPGFHANRTIARAPGLAHKNTALIHPGEKDLGLLGSPMKFSLLAGENEVANPWEPYHVSHGFDADESTITLAGVRSFLQFPPRSATADGVLEAMRYNLVSDMIGVESASHRKTVYYLLSPYNADELAAADLSKGEIKQFLANNSALAADKYQVGAVVPEDTIGSPAAPGKVKRLQLPQIESPDRVKLIVVGGPGRFNAVGHSIGGPVTKRISLPGNFDELCEEYVVERDWG
jgi:hypothetical protein